MALNRRPGALRVDILNAAGTAKLAGTNLVRSFKRTRRLNAPWEAEIVLLGADPKTSMVTFGRRYRVFHKTRGALGEFIHREHARAGATGDSAISIQASSTLSLLARKSALFNRQYKDVKASIAAQAAVALMNEADPLLGAPARTWAFSAYDPLNRLPDITMEVQGHSVLAVLDVLRKTARASFRETSPYRVEFGDFASGTVTTYGEVKYGEAKYLGDFVGVTYYATNMARLTPEAEGSTRLIVEDCTIAQTSDKVANRLVVLGAGDGLNQLTMEPTFMAGTRPYPQYPYEVKRRVNPDGTGCYYIEDATSISNYDVYEDTIVRSDIRPLTNSDTSIRLASDALYDIGAAYLQKCADPATSYSISVRKMASGLDVGNTLRFRYKGTARYTDDSGTEAYQWIDVDTAATVTEIEEVFDADGAVQARLTISTNGEHIPTDVDVVLGVQSELNALKVRVQPYPCVDTISVRDEISGVIFNHPDGRPDDDNLHDVEMAIPIGEEVLYVWEAELRFKVMPLRSTISSVSLVGAFSSPDWFSANRRYQSHDILVTSPNLRDVGGQPENSEPQWDKVYPALTSTIPHIHRTSILGGNNQDFMTGNDVAGTYVVGGERYVFSLGRPQFTLSAVNGALYQATIENRHAATFFLTGGADGDPSHGHGHYVGLHYHGLPPLSGTGTARYGIYDDDPAHAPTQVQVWLNDEWVGTYDISVGAGRTLSLANALKDASGGLRQDHRLRFSCPQSNRYGTIHATVRLFKAAQATIQTV